ncbi:rhodanese-like domain-containing protein [Campylobacter sp. US33a]|uniref:Rhodanese-like domain-containing protein n=1 Tax=Campylobacter sp. CCS1377 TaxID=3158229 RepID=A0AAU7E6W2_9BACT|nr:rhodanese-like domain-containing protein [Campylobacter sp. US33a]MCW1361141.1 rhodanese-like domain-containing protein [Campylobacter jejuni]TEY00494.1 rhodanese-like domain-containing protein [Campylobacter sp. US33a]
MKKVILGLLIFLELGFSQISGSIMGEELNRLQESIEEKENYLVVDLRDITEYKKGHLKHAINIPLNSLNQNFDFLNTTREENIILISNEIKDIKNAANILTQANIKKKIIVAPDLNTYNYTLYKQKNIKGKDLQALADKGEVIILDARLKEDYVKAHFKNAINVPEAKMTPEILDHIKKASQNGKKPIVTHCYRGNDGNKLSQIMLKEGFEDVTNSVDGTKEFNFHFNE